MTVTGAADPASEREAFQQATLEARLLAERRRELLRSGASAADADAVTSLDAETRARVLKEVYRSTDLPNKPRNALGFARDIPGPEMEALLKARTLVTADAMRELALQRGLAVRDTLLAKGLPGERLFLAAPKLRASGEEDAAWTPRVQLALDAVPGHLWIVQKDTRGPFAESSRVPEDLEYSIAGVAGVRDAERSAGVVMLGAGVVALVSGGVGLDRTGRCRALAESRSASAWGERAVAHPLAWLPPGPVWTPAAGAAPIEPAAGAER